MTPTTEIEKYIRELEAAGFYGELTLKFQKGEIVHARKIESLNLPKPSRTERKHHEPFE